DSVDVVDVHPHADFLDLVGQGVDVGGQGRDVLPLDGGDKGLGQLVGHAVAAFVGGVLDVVDLVHPLGHPGRVKAAENVLQHQGSLAGKTGALDKIVKINGVLLLRHNFFLLLCYQICMNTLAMTKLMRPHPGKVKNQVSIIALTAPELMADRRLTAPTPMMALVLVWVVDTGMPSRLEYSRQSAPARSAQKPWYRSSLTMSMP